jgi:HD-like signal output (HDOD) protein
MKQHENSSAPWNPEIVRAPPPPAAWSAWSLVTRSEHCILAIAQLDSKRRTRMSKIIYVVDDESDVLQTLGSLLRRLDPTWQVTEFSTPQQALSTVRTFPPNLVLSDEQMPGMTGSQLLESTRQLAPNAVRIILSSHAQRLEGIGVAHQYLGKPFDLHDVESRVEQALDAQICLQNTELARLMMPTTSFPALPGIYVELLRELDKVDCSLERTADLVRKDGGVYTRLIQLANSPLFSGPGTVTEPMAALLQLGTSTVKALVLSLKVFQSYNSLNFPELPVASIWEHSWKTAKSAQEFCRKKLGENAANDALLAGLVRDLGCLILMENEPERYREVCKMACRGRKSLLEAEFEAFHATHLEVSCFMLRLWGMPKTVLEAVTFCNAPWNGANADLFSPSVALYVADILRRREKPPDGFLTPEPNSAYLQSVGAQELLEPSA